MPRFSALLVLFLLAPIFAHAQGVSLTVSCTPATMFVPVCRSPTDCDAPLPIPADALTTFSLYRPDQPAALASGYTACSFKRTNLTPGMTLQHYVTQVTNGKESGPSETVTSQIAPVDPVCSGAPPNETRSQSCPAPTTGTFEQSHDWVSAPAPGCWMANAWGPATPPAGVCITPPTTLVTASTSAYEQRSASLPLALVGLTSIGLPCGPETLTRNGVKYCSVSKAQVDAVVWPSNLAQTQFWVRSSP